ncbi:polysaccharide biosynthesis protein [Clostridium sp. ZBS12]|uniref:polysaccharide biosynthesis protein n=1 Tax=Clostridium sp. ZBS12 TaxID=2949972 RepID=UPI00207997FC|nr:polysaccharide biosynthesis protein [Clostridium sp. ZBS12]
MVKKFLKFEPSVIRIFSRDEYKQYVIERELDVAENSIEGEVFVLKMPIIKLKDLAEVVVEETCKKYNIELSEVKIKIIGLIPGEKMYEGLMTEEESEFAYDIGNMYAVLPTTVPSENYDEFYSNHTKALKEKYSSQRRSSIGKEKLRGFIINEKLI